MLRQLRLIPDEQDRRPKWLNSPVTYHEGTLAGIRQHIPTFERRGFGLTQPGDDRSHLNGRLDTIIRLPLGDDPAFIPVGVVSKEYSLVPHTAVLEVATAAMEAAKVPVESVWAELKITEYGERMALSMYLPDQYQFDPGDGHPMALRLECLNSVDGSTRFRVLMGWFRFVCSNGLVIGVTRADIRRRHVGEFQIEDVGAVLQSGLKDSATEKLDFERWRKTPVGMDRLLRWVEKDLWKCWGFKAATRAYHIARTGHDVEISGPYKDNKPTTIPVHRVGRVPGSPMWCQDLFALSQILAWLAKERRDLQEQVEWREQIPGLLASLN